MKLVQDIVVAIRILAGFIKYGLPAIYDYLAFKLQMTSLYYALTPVAVMLARRSAYGAYLYMHPPPLVYRVSSRQVLAMSYLTARPYRETYHLTS